MLIDLKNVFNKNQQFEELTELAKKYKIDVENFQKLQIELEQKPDDCQTVDLGGVLEAVGVLDRHRLERCISRSVTFATEEFVRNVTKTLHQSEVPGKSSRIVAKNGIYEFQLLPEIAACLTKAAMDAALNRSKTGLADAVVFELDGLWNRFCSTIIDCEKRLLAATLPLFRKLAAYVLRLAQMRENGKPNAQIRKTAKAEYPRISHVVRRLQVDDFWTSHTVPIVDLTFSTAADDDTGADDAFVHWLDQNGRRLHDALSIDCARIDELQKTSEFDTAWHDLALCSTSSDPTTSAVLMPPQYTSFKPSRVYAVESGPSHNTRAIGIVRVLFVVRSLVADGFWLFDKFALPFAKQIVESEKQNTTHKLSGVLENLMEVCHQHDVRLNVAELDKFLDSLIAPSTTMPSTDRSPTSSAFVCSVAMPVVGAFGARGGDFLCVPERPAKHKTHGFWPSRVEQHSFLEYVVVYTILQLLAESTNTLLHVLAFSNSAIVQKATSILQSLSVANASMENHNSLRQTTAQVCKKLIKAGTNGVEAATRAGVGAGEWECSFAPTTKKSSENVLFISSSKRSHSAFLFVDLCSRVKAFLDEDYPLHFGVMWERSAHRPRRRKSSSGPADTGEPSEPEA